MKKRGLKLTCLALATLLLLAACGGGASSAAPAASTTPAASAASGAAPASAAPSAKDTFTYGMTAEPKTLNALVADDFVAYTVTNQLYDNLICQKPDGSLVPGLAEKWEYNEDATEITFTLRKGVKFHNGDELTAADVQYTFDNVIPHPPAQNLTSSMDHMETVDDYTVKLFLKYPFGPIEYCVAGSQLGIVNKKAHEADPDGFSRKPVGTGPYKIVEWRSGDKIILTRHDEYFEGPPHMKDVTFKIITDKSTAVVALENGEVDMTEPGKPDRNNLMNNPAISFHEVEQVSTYFIAMNNKYGTFKDQNLRLAVAHAIDKESLLIGALDGVGSVSNTPMSKVFGWPEDFAGIPYDPAKAKEYLAAGGYPDGGLKIVFTTMENPDYVKPTEIIQEQLRQVGIEVEIVKMERAAFLETLLTKKDYEISVMSATAFYPDSDYLYNQYHSDPSEKGRNYCLNENPELDKLLEDARKSQDPEERKKMYLEVCEIFAETAIQVPLFNGVTQQASSAKLQGFSISPMRRIYVKDFYWVD